MSEDAKAGIKPLTPTQIRQAALDIHMARRANRNDQEEQAKKNLETKRTPTQSADLYAACVAEFNQLAQDAAVRYVDENRWEYKISVTWVVREHSWLSDSDRAAAFLNSTEWAAGDWEVSCTADTLIFVEKC